MEKPDILIYGSGNVAYHFASRFLECGLSFALHARASEHGDRLSQLLGMSLNVPCLPRVVLLAISDHALPEVSEHLLHKNPAWIDALWLHTSGSQPITVIAAPRKGSLYPLQTFHRDKARLNWAHLPLFVEAADADLPELQQLAEILSPKVRFLDSQGRLRLHLSAVFACNFSNYCYSIASKLMEQNGLDFQLLQPLLEETLAKALALGSAKAQTGPAVRGDEVVMNKHLELLKATPELAEIYRMLSEGIRRG